MDSHLRNSFAEPAQSIPFSVGSAVSTTPLAFRCLPDDSQRAETAELWMGDEDFPDTVLDDED